MGAIAASLQRCTRIALLRVALPVATAAFASIVISPCPPPRMKLASPAQCSITTTSLRKPAWRTQLNTLIRAGYRPTTMAAMLDAFDGITPVPPGCIVLTFDDALRSQHRNAIPVPDTLGSEWNVFSHA